MFPRNKGDRKKVKRFSIIDRHMARMPIHGSFNFLDLSSIHLGGGIVIARRGRIVRVLRRGCHHSRTIWRSCESARHGPFIYAIVYVYALHPRIDVVIRRDAPSVEVKGRHVWIISSTRHFHKWKRKTEIVRSEGKGVVESHGPRLQRDREGYYPRFIRVDKIKGTFTT